MFPDYFFSCVYVKRIGNLGNRFSNFFRAIINGFLKTNPVDRNVSDYFSCIFSIRANTFFVDNGILRAGRDEFHARVKGFFGNGFIFNGILFYLGLPLRCPNCEKDCK